MTAPSPEEGCHAVVTVVAEVLVTVGGAVVTTVTEVWGGVVLVVVGRVVTVLPQPLSTTERPSMLMATSIHVVDHVHRGDSKEHVGRDVRRGRGIASAFPAMSASLGPWWYRRSDLPRRFRPLSAL